MNIYTKILLRSDWKNKDGSKTVNLRITINRKVAYFSLKIKVAQNCWNEKNATVLKRDHQFFQKNNLIRKYKVKAESIVYDYTLQGKSLSVSEFKQQFYNNTYGTNSFYEFIESDIKKSAKTLAKETLKGYKSQLNKLKSFKSELNFTDVDFSFIRSYEVEMLQINNRNTVNKSLTFIKTFINKAIDQNVFKGKNPFDKYSISRVQGKRDYLTINEVEKLENLLFNDQLKANKKRVLKYFLFCCYTGLRYTDIKLLKFKDIQTEYYNNKDSKIIKIDMHKTKKPVSIPILSFAESLISYPEPFINEMTVFNVMSSQPTNRYLKEIAKQAGINKHVSFHVARHTFATNSIEYGIPIEVISQILGHSDLKTTQIYAKVSNKVKFEQMQKIMK